MGADLSLVEARFLYWLLTCDEIGLPRIAADRGRAALASVAGLWGRVVDGGKVSEEEWAAAGAAAWAAARAAEWAAAARDDAGADADAGADDRDAAWSKMATKLISLLGEAPVDHAVPCES